MSQYLQTTRIGRSMDRATAAARVNNERDERHFQTSTLFRDQTPVLVEGVTTANTIGISAETIDGENLLRAATREKFTYGKEQCFNQRLPCTPYMAHGFGNVHLENEMRANQIGYKSRKSENEYPATAIYARRVDADRSAVGTLLAQPVPATLTIQQADDRIGFQQHMVDLGRPLYARGKKRS